MADEDVVRRDRALPDRRLPVDAVGRELDLLHDEVDDAVADLVLAPHVVVERHRLDAQLLPELAHAQRLEAALVCEADGGAEHALPAERDAGLGCRLGRLARLAIGISGIGA